MSDFVSQQEFSRLLAQLETQKREVLDAISHMGSGINARLDTLNSKTATHSVQIAVLEEKADAAHKDSPARLVGALGLLGAAIGGAMSWFRH